MPSVSCVSLSRNLAKAANNPSRARKCIGYWYLSSVFKEIKPTISLNNISLISILQKFSLKIHAFSSDSLASYAIPVRRAGALPAASFRPHLPVAALAVRLMVPAAGPRARAGSPGRPPARISRTPWPTPTTPRSPSKSAWPRASIGPTRERLYVIKGLTFDGVDVYTKGKILKKEEVEVFLCPHLIEKKHRRLRCFPARSVENLRWCGSWKPVGWQTGYRLRTSHTTSAAHVARVFSTMTP